MLVVGHDLVTLDEAIVNLHNIPILNVGNAFLILPASH